MSDTTLAANKYVAHFNKVVSNYAEAIAEGDRERHSRAAASLDVLMQEYAQAAALLDHVNGRCWEQIEAVYHEGDGRHIDCAEGLGECYPPIASELLEFAKDVGEHREGDAP